MIKRFFILCIATIIFSNYVVAQCTGLGQTPSTAFPVCGTTVFEQTTVPICVSHDLYVPGCANTQNGGAAYADKNPYFYKFTCYSTGTFGFSITPKDLGDDYDWQLYDVTGLDPNAIYTNNKTVISGNWAGTYGATGAKNGGLNYIECASDPSQNLNSFASMPTLIAGHNYILMVSHFTDSQSGYDLSFGGGTASIVDPKLPTLQSAEATCDAQQVRVFLNKKMKCSSLAANGSDFSINTTLTTVIAAQSVQCSNGFDMDSVLLTLSTPLAPGNYSVVMKKSTIDGNTLLDNCDREIPVGSSIPFKIIPLLPTPMDSITKVKCAPQTLELVFKKPMKCNSVAADGSDFVVTGPVPVTVMGAAGAACTDGVSKKILVQLNAPLLVGGIYNIALRAGTDGGGIVDECAQATPLGSNLSFAVADTVNADFTHTVAYACNKDIVNYNYVQRNNVNVWLWTFDNTVTSNLQNPVITYEDFTPKQVQLIVSNGVCSDTTKQTITFDNLIIADFEITNIVCPNDPAKIINNTVGRIIEWNWNFGNGGTSTIKKPPPQNYNPLVSSDYIAKAQLIARNDYGCYDTIIKPVKVVFSCYIAVPTAFTPNGDGLNDYLYPLSAYKATNLSFSVYNRFGQRVFFSNNWQNKWDGKFNGQGADPGTYVWVLSYTSIETNRRVEQKGTSILIR